MPNARVGAMPQTVAQQEQHNVKRRNKYSKGITMEDLKYQTAMRLAQEQTRRTSTFSSNRKPTVNSGGSLPSSTLSHRKKHDHMLKSSGSKHVSKSSIQNHVPSSYDKNQHQQSNTMNSSRYVPSLSHEGKGAFRPIKKAIDERRDVGPSEHFQQQVSHHYDYPTKSRSVYHSHDLKPQRSMGSSLNSKRQSSSKTYRHGLTVQELKEMTRSRLAAEASCDQVSDGISSMQKKPEPEQPVRKGSLLRNIRECLNFDGSGRQKSRSSEPIPTIPSLGTYPSNSFSSCNTENSRENSFEQIRMTPSNQNTQQHTFLHNPIQLKLQESTSRGRMYQDNMLSPHSSYSYDSFDAFDNTSVHSFNSGVGSERSYFHSSRRANQPNNSQLHSASFPEIGRTLETRDPLSNNSNIIGGSLLSSPSTPSTLSPSHLLHTNYENEQGAQHRTPNGREPCHRIFGKTSSDTVPTVNLSVDSQSDTDIPMAFSSPMTNISQESFCDSEDTDFVPLNFHTYNRSSSDGSFSRNGELPNSVAESVLNPNVNSLSGVMQRHGTQIDSYEGTPSRHSSVEPTYITQDRYNSKSWDDPDDVSIAQFLDEFETRLKVGSSNQASSSSFFVSKIDPEVTKY